MFLLGLLALAVLPLLIGVAQASAGNRTLATANGFAASVLAPIRAEYPTNDATASCAAARASLPATAVDGPEGSGLSADVSVGSCPAEFPATLPVTVSVYRTGAPDSPLVTLPTLVMVARP